MAVEAPLLHIGYLQSTGDYRNSTLSGTTHTGPNGSPQYQFVKVSTVGDLAVQLCTAAGQVTLGVLQNKPGVGDAADVGYGGISKVVCGTTTVLAGGKIMTDSSGCAVAYSSAAGVASAGIAVMTPQSVGEVFSAFIFGPSGPGSIA